MKEEISWFLFNFFKETIFIKSDLYYTCVLSYILCLYILIYKKIYINIFFHIPSIELCLFYFLRCILWVNEKYFCCYKLYNPISNVLSRGMIFCKTFYTAFEINLWKHKTNYSYKQVIVWFEIKLCLLGSLYELVCHCVMCKMFCW